MLPIFENETGNGNSAAFKIAEAFEDSQVPSLAGETFTAIASGVFNGVTITMQAGPTRSGPWVDLDEGVFTAEGVKVGPLSRRAYIRAVRTGAGASTDVSLWIG